MIGKQFKFGISVSESNRKISLPIGTVVFVPESAFAISALGVTKDTLLNDPEILGFLSERCA